MFSFALHTYDRSRRILHHIGRYFIRNHEVLQSRDLRVSLVDDGCLCLAMSLRR